MNMEHHVVAIIPARCGSKAVYKKNIKPLSGKPLISYTIAEALKSKLLDMVFVSTEDKEIAEIAASYGAEVIERPVELAEDDTPTLPVLQHAIQYLEEVEDYAINLVVLLQPTSPLRTVEDIDRSIQKLLTVGCDSVVSVCEVDYSPYSMYALEEDKLQPIIEGGKGIPRRQDALKVYKLNGAVYVTCRDVIMKEGRIMGDDTRAFVMPSERSLDIDTEIDFRLAEILMSGSSNLNE